MSTLFSPSDDHIPTATLALPSIAAPSSSSASRRRLPPPCWSPEETVALIDAYRDKWYSLRRGNLRANHWQEVADAVASRCPANPPKTAVQCRHKMEKLRKRYRNEIQRASALGGVRRFTSAWVHFQNMHTMEKGPTPPSSSSDDEEDDEDYNHKNSSIKRINDLYNYNPKGNIVSNDEHDYNSSMNGFRIKIPGQVTAGPSIAKVYSKFDEMAGLIPNYPNPNPRFANSIAVPNGAASSKIMRDGFVQRGETRKRESSETPVISKGDSGVGELVAAIEAMGEGFMKMEKVKMDMVREIQEMRMKMELKRTEMILDSEKRIVEAFVNAVSERSVKKAKRNDCA